MRKLGAGLPEYSEGSHSGAVAFKSRGRMFATLRAVSGGDAQIVVGLEPEHATLLIEKDPRFERYPRAPHTVSLRVSLFKWSEVEPLVRESHALATAPKRPRRPK
jgi:predicted DNA-binding protein (MmcQ/YjbR family)